MSRILAAIVIGAVLLLALLVYSQQRPETLRVSGAIEADEIRIGSRVGGRVKAVHVAEGAIVQAGDLLLELEPFDLDEELQQAEATLAERRHVLQALKNGSRPEEIAQASQKVAQLAAVLRKLKNGARPEELDAARALQRQAEFQYDLAVKNQQRAETLLQKMAITQEEMDQANAELKVARAGQDARLAELALLEAGTREEDVEEAAARLAEAEEVLKLAQAGPRREVIEEAEAAVAAAEAAANAIRARLGELRIVSPTVGRIEAIELQAGDLVGANTPAVALLDQRKLWVRAYVPENHLDLQVGQRLPVTVDSFPGREFAGELTFLARQAEFTPGNVQTPEERSKQVFRIKVALAAGADQLHPGMNADVWLPARK